MGNRCRVLFCGNSLFMAGLVASLKGREEFEVVRLKGDPSAACVRLQELHPHAIILDLNSTHAGFALSVLKEHPGIPVIGLDSACNAVTVLSSQKHITPTASALVEVLQREMKLKG